MLSVVIPTISGRELSLARAIKAYENVLAEYEWELIVIEDRPNWPAACNEGYGHAKGDMLHFSADDLEPLPGAFDEVTAWLTGHDELPAPRCLNHSPEGEFDNAEDGPDGAITWFTRIPIMRRDQYERIGPWPEYHYVADIWLSEKARILGIETRIFYSYAFVHHWHQVGRKDDQGTLALAAKALAELRRQMAKEAHMPATNLGPDRWVSAGVNEGGDQMYQRNRAAPATTGPHGSQPPEAAETSYEDLTKDELSAALESRGLPKTGNKDELIARLEEADKA